MVGNKKTFIKSKNDLIDALQSKSDNDLDNPILINDSTVYITLHGHIQHAYYHFGQITHMKKAIENLDKR